MTRRRFTPEYKLRIVREAERSGRGGIGRLLKREGLAYSHLAKWRRIREKGELASLAPKKRGPRTLGSVEREEIAALRAEVERLEADVSKLMHLVGSSEGLLRSLLVHGLDRQARVFAVERLAGIWGVKIACEIAGIPRSTYYRQRR